MMLGPFGLQIFSLFVGFAVLLLLKGFGGRVWRVSGVAVTTVSLISSFVIAVFGAEIFNTESSSLLSSRRISEVSVILLLAFCVLNHLNIVILEKAISFEVLIFELMGALFASLLIKADNLLVLVVVLPLLILLFSSLPYCFNQVVGGKALGKGLVYTLTFFVLASSLAAFWSFKVETTVVSDLAMLHGNIEVVKTVFLGWLFGAVLLLTLLFLPPFQLFDKEYELTLSWPVFSYFRWLGPLVAFLVCINWTYALAGYWKGSYFEWLEVMGWGINKILMVTFVVIFLWSLVAMLLSKKLHSYFSAMLISILFYSSIGFLTGDVQGISWAMLALFIYVLFCPIAALVMSRSRIPLASLIEDISRLFHWQAFPGRLTLFVMLFLMVPVGSQVLFSVLKVSFPLWFADGIENNLLKIILCGVAFGLSVFLHKCFKMFAATGQGGPPMSSTQGIGNIRLWHYTLLIPFIILGIYPFPLYNYVKLIFTSNF